MKSLRLVLRNVLAQTVRTVFDSKSMLNQFASLYRLTTLTGPIGSVRRS